MALDALKCNHLAPLGFKGIYERNEIHSFAVGPPSIERQTCV